MSSLGDWAYRTVVADHGPLGSFADQLGELVGRYGSQRKLSEATGVQRKTLYNWLVKGATPRKSSLARVTAMVRETRIDPARPGDAAVQLTLIERGAQGKNDGRERVVTGRQLQLRPGTMRRVTEAYVATGDPEVMAAAFLSGVRNGFYRAWLTPKEERGRGGPVDAPEPADDEDRDDEQLAIDELYEQYDGPSMDDVVDDYPIDDDPADGDPEYGFDVA